MVSFENLTLRLISQKERNRRIIAAKPLKVFKLLKPLKPLKPLKSPKPSQSLRKPKTEKFEVITIMVKGQRFLVEEDVLSYHVPFLRRLLNSDTVERRTGIIHFKNTTPEAMTLFLRWLDQGDVADEDHQLDSTTVVYLDLAVLANQLYVAGAQNKALEALYTVLTNTHNLELNLNAAYAGTESGSIIRRFLVDVYMMHVGDKEMANAVRWRPSGSGFPKDFMTEYHRAIAIWGKDPDGGVEFVLSRYFINTLLVHDNMALPARW